MMPHFPGLLCSAFGCMRFHSHLSQMLNCDLGYIHNDIVIMIRTRIGTSIASRCCLLIFTSKRTPMLDVANVGVQWQCLLTLPELLVIAC